MYTKGPWKWEKGIGATAALVRDAKLEIGDKVTILVHEAQWDVDPEDMDLVKAAPDMCEALQEALAELEYITHYTNGASTFKYHERIAQIRQALAKATGRSED